ncbi:MAG: hypothetical protein IT373_00915 [Polyangiaceae bacterium]|nr:hypothetical protein [Polyangiaceae bacterium]
MNDEPAPKERADDRDQGARTRADVRSPDWAHGKLALGCSLAAVLCALAFWLVRGWLAR